MRKILKIFSVIILALVIFGAIIIGALNSLVDSSLSKREIFKLAENYSEIIISDIYDNNFDDTLAVKGVTDVRVGDVVDINCGGKGFGSATSYYGFYYNQKDEPVVMFNGNVYSDELIEEDNGYSYTENNSDNRYYTEKIITHFYYYEWHY